MGKLISLVKQPVLEHLTPSLNRGCSSEMYLVEIQHCAHTCGLAVLVKVRYLTWQSFIYIRKFGTD